MEMSLETLRGLHFDRGQLGVLNLQFQSLQHRWPFEDELLVVGGCCYTVSPFPPARSQPAMPSPALESSSEKPKVSTVTKRSIGLAGRKTSISLEDAFWKALREIAEAQGTTLSDLVSSIDAGRQRDNLSSAIRMFILNYYLSKCAGDVQPK
jgi:predicted DNA-binding ribbon-helix-helix protein